MIKKVIAGVLEIAYLETGPSNGAPVVLLHGFPYDVHSYDEVARILASEGKRCLIPVSTRVWPYKVFELTHNAFW